MEAKPVNDVPFSSLTRLWSSSHARTKSELRRREIYKISSARVAPLPGPSQPTQRVIRDPPYALTGLPETKECRMQVMRLMRDLQSVTNKGLDLQARGDVDEPSIPSQRGPFSRIKGTSRSQESSQRCFDKADRDVIGRSVKPWVEIRSFPSGSGLGGYALAIRMGRNAQTSTGGLSSLS